MKKKAIIQKNDINVAFEKMKTKGKMDPRIMEKLGISSVATQSRAASVGPHSFDDRSSMGKRRL